MDLVRGSALTLIYRVAGSALWMVVSIILARMLSVRDLGIYVATVVIVQAVGSVAASYASATGYFVARRGRLPAEVAVHGLLLAVLTSSVLFLAALGAWAITGERVVLLAGAAIFPIVARHALGGVFLGEGRLFLYNFGLHGPAVAITLLLLAWLAIPGERTADGALTIWLVAQYLSLAALLRWPRGQWRWLLAHGVDRDLARGILTFGGVIGLAGVVSYFNYRVDQLLVAGLDSAAGAGIYSRAVALAEGLWLISTSTAIASYASVGSAGRSESARVTARGVRHTLLLVASGAIVLAVLGPFLLGLLFGERYVEAGTALRVLCLGTALFAPQSLLSNYFTVQLGRPWLPLSVAAMSCLVNIGLSLVLIPRVGYVGGAWATTVSYALAGVLSVTLFLRTSDASPSDLWRPRRDDLVDYVRAARGLLRHPAPARPAAGEGEAAP